MLFKCGCNHFNDFGWQLVSRLRLFYLCFGRVKRRRVLTSISIAWLQANVLNNCRQIYFEVIPCTKGIQCVYRDFFLFRFNTRVPIYFIKMNLVDFCYQIYERKCWFYERFNLRRSIRFFYVLDSVTVCSKCVS